MNSAFTDEQEELRRSVAKRRTLSTGTLAVIAEDAGSHSDGSTATT
jgi:hypothetical protein